MRFKVGDIVKLIEPPSSSTTWPHMIKGSIHKVVRINHIGFIGLDGDLGYWRGSRFILVHKESHLPNWF